MGLEYCGKALGDLLSQQVVDEAPEIMYTEVTANTRQEKGKRETDFFFFFWFLNLCSWYSQIQMFLLHCNQSCYEANFPVDMISTQFWPIFERLKTAFCFRTPQYFFPSYFRNSKDSIPLLLFLLSSQCEISLITQRNYRYVAYMLVLHFGCTLNSWILVSSFFSSSCEH